ncbi:macro domain-containing protein [Succinivibrio dextrinosolvens]|uniref:O-acetyl-ADP-ribose deacetylase (Regulator of RNase III), contains Macro domain n=1 Tax=Succinivibrio dextrinosolvens TaxID=83771 RepID=A0A662ZC69_9GAMM|nr:macro domain-containing protein [Succinivibrio dextrinosolvens]SFK17631.1 O-acetyl-ADP-ribose deacetylase (regulator of RNase III), contains Macro domain [Succinivibrio dextrinosolvens]
MIEKEPLVEKLIDILVQYVPSLKNQAQSFSDDYFAQRALLRGLMNMHRVQNKLPPEYFTMQDQLLQAELSEKKLVQTEGLLKAKINSNMSLHQGDITTLKVDAIVNSATPSLLGCFQAGHNCIDNCIHSAAGLQLRYECYKILGGGEAREGTATITHGFNLPCKFVIHVVGPKVGFNISPREKATLASCYTEALKVARKNGVKSLAFCSISTDSLGFPNSVAARIAVNTVNEDLKAHGNDLKIVFSVESDRDAKAYKIEFDPHPEKDSAELHPFFNINLI